MRWRRGRPRRSHRFGRVVMRCTSCRFRRNMEATECTDAAPICELCGADMSPARRRFENDEGNSDDGA